MRMILWAQCINGFSTSFLQFSETKPRIFPGRKCKGKYYLSLWTPSFTKYRQLKLEQKGYFYSRMLKFIPPYSLFPAFHFWNCQLSLFWPVLFFNEGLFRYTETPFFIFFCMPYFFSYKNEGIYPQNFSGENRIPFPTFWTHFPDDAFFHLPLLL